MALHRHLRNSEMLRGIFERFWKKFVAQVSPQGLDGTQKIQLEMRAATSASRLLHP
jgi:hypothetical protein